MGLELTIIWLLVLKTVLKCIHPVNISSRVGVDRGWETKGRNQKFLSVFNKQKYKIGFTILCIF